FQTFFGFKVSGIEAYSSIQFKMIEKNMFNGGDFGFEGSILSILIQIALIFAIIFIEKKSVKRR
ncbi:MAG: CPBP family intramembrane glutamate endopeptidase, partial [Bacteroidota bacterium]